MINKKVDEALFETILEQAFNDVLEEDYERLIRDRHPVSVSKEYKARILKIIHGKEKRRTFQEVAKVAKYAIFVLVILLNIGLISIVCVPTVSAEVKNVISSIFDEYTSYSSSNVNNDVKFTTDDYEINYLPPYFELDYQENGTYLYFSKKDSDKYIIIEFLDSEYSETNRDNENSEEMIIKIDGYDAYILTSKHTETTNLFWHNDEHFIIIQSNLDENEIIKIAQNIEKY